MSRLIHRLYIYSLVAITVAVFVFMGLKGLDYYSTPIEERFHHEQNELLKPSGFIGHGAGIIGSLLIIVGVFGYMARKRMKKLARLGFLKHWLEFHIFLCSVGPILILYHTSFKFGGIVAISFWSMVAVVVSGIIGRFIYLQIPRSIEGRELSLNELNIVKSNFYYDIQEQFSLDIEFVRFLNDIFNKEAELYEGSFFSKVIARIRYERKLLRNIRLELRKRNITKSNTKKIKKMIRGEIVLNRRIAWLSTMQNYLRYWHVIHLPFAFSMLIIMIVHVVVAVLFGYVWIF